MKLLIIFSILLKCLAITKVPLSENEKIQTSCAAPEAGRSSRVKRLLNGDAVSSGNMNYAVDIEVGGDGKYGAVRCSGTIISRKHVLTAAHCFVKSDTCRTARNTKDPLSHFKKTQTYVFFGGKCVADPKGGGTCGDSKLNKKVIASKIAVHSRYLRKRCKAHDIAIVEMAVPLPAVSNDVDYACLPKRTTELASTVFSSGYGLDPNDPKAPQKFLQKAIFTVNRVCDASLKAGMDTFCTEERTQFMCKGDSGSGVIQSANSKKDFVMGVLRGGLVCSLVKDRIQQTEKEKRHFRGSVNTDVRMYLRWICGLTGICGKGVEPSATIDSSTIYIL